jgi:hypothetical protein
MNKKFLYYLIQWTWGIPMSLLGLIMFIVLKVCGCRSYWYRNAVCMVVPWNFGGLELGMFFIRGKWNERVCAHEYGHSIQNLWWGPLFPIIIAIPSATRYWWRVFYMKYIYKRTRKRLPPYDSIWFEGQATKLGNKANDNYWTWL